MKETRIARHRDFTPALMLLPAAVIMACIIVYPILNSINMSFQYYVFAHIKDKGYIGFQNYATALKDPAFKAAVLNSLRWIFITVPCQFVLGMVLALLLNRKFKAVGVLRSASMISWVTSGVVIALMWSWIYNANFGVLNDLLKKLGLIKKNVAWLADPKTALNSEIVTMVWQGIPFFAVMLLAAMQSISPDLYEAAAVEGANSFQSFWRITFPLLLPTIGITSMLRFIWVANNVDIIYQMTQGGPGYSSLTLSVYAYMSAQKSMDFGYASALAVYGVIFMIGLMILYVNLLNGKERR